MRSNYSLEINHFLRKQFQSQPLLYYFWFKLYRSNGGIKKQWFDKRISFYFDGYPRSGNTFMAHLINSIYDNEKILHHYHVIAPLKIALRNKIKSIIIIREPQECISSNYIKKFEKTKMPLQINQILLQNLLTDYIVYYEYIKKKYDEVYIVNFNKLVSHPERTLLNIDIFLNNLSGIKNEKDFLEKISKVKSISFGSKSKLGSSLPNLDKEKLKIEIKNNLTDLNNFSSAENIFNDLVK